MLRLPTPKVALMIVLGMKQIRANRATPPGVSNVFRPLDHRLISQAPTTPSSVLPAAIASKGETQPAVVALEMKAPTKIAGEIRYPSSSTVAKANPVGGQIGVALG